MLYNLTTNQNKNVKKIDNRKAKILDDLLKEIRYRGAYAVSRASGVPKTTIESWLYGKAIPSLVKAAIVADAIGLELLLFDKEN